MNDASFSDFSDIQLVLAARGGVLSRGAHGDCEGACCALEAVALVRLSHATDSPTDLDMPDLRPLNDAAWSSDAIRTEHMLPVLQALWDYPSWDASRRVRFAQSLALETVRQVLPVSLESIGLPEHARACRGAETLDAARAAAARATAYAAADAARAAYAAARATDDAAYDAARATAYAAADAAADADAVLTVACRVWVQAAEASAQ